LDFDPSYFRRSRVCLVGWWKSENRITSYTKTFSNKDNLESLPQADVQNEKNAQQRSLHTTDPSDTTLHDFDCDTCTIRADMSTMKAAIATGFGNIDENIHVNEKWPRPTLLPHQDTGFMVIHVLACALAPGDVRLLSGKTDYVQQPKSGHPYNVVGSDVCGIVVELEDDETYFHVGDKVISRFDAPQPIGGVAEFRLVKTSLSEKAPTSISSVEACTLPASAMAAKLLATKFVKPNQRVLILGGSGGVGNFLCQFVKVQGAYYLAATSTATQLVSGLGCDRRTHSSNSRPVVSQRKESDVPWLYKSLLMHITRLSSRLQMNRVL
jgi:D-arabinose 1-dehydrogenase-like Zn-dependent alcohol dehydrogenase